MNFRNHLMYCVFYLIDFSVYVLACYSKSANSCYVCILVISTGRTLHYKNIWMLQINVCVIVDNI